MKGMMMKTIEKEKYNRINSSQANYALSDAEKILRNLSPLFACSRDADDINWESLERERKRGENERTKINDHANNS